MQRWSDQGDSWMSGHVGSDDHKLCSLDVFGLHSNSIKCEGLFVRSLLGNLLCRFVCCAKVGKSFAHCLLCQVLAYHGRTSWFSPRRQPQMWRRMPCWPCCTASMLDGGTEEILRTTRHMQKEYANTKEWWFGFHFAFSLFAWMSLAATLHVWRCLGIKTWDHAFATSFFSGTIWSRRLLRLNDVSGSKSSFFWMTFWRRGRPFGSEATFKCRAGRDTDREKCHPTRSDWSLSRRTGRHPTRSLRGARVRRHDVQVHHLHHSLQLAPHGRRKAEDRISELDFQPRNISRDWAARPPAASIWDGNKKMREKRGLAEKLM